MRKLKKKFEYKWVVAAICFLMVFSALGLCSSNKSLYLGAITDALEIPRSAFSLNDTFRYVTQVIINMFFGALVNKFGTKKLMCAGFLCLVASSSIYAFATNIFVFYIGGVFLGLGLSWTTTTMVGFVVGKWFKEKKGTVMGAVLAANGVGAALSAQIVTPIIYKSTFGYRNAYLLSAFFGIVIFLIILLFYREKNDGEKYQEKVRDLPNLHSSVWQSLDPASAFTLSIPLLTGRGLPFSTKPVAPQSTPIPAPRSPREALLPRELPA